MSVTNSEQVTQSAVQEEKRNLLARLLSHLAHEIRNPLSSLDIHVQLLEEDLAVGPGQAALPKPILDRFQIIHGELRRLENIVTRFIQLAGPSDLELASLSLNELVLQIRDLLGPDAEERKVNLEIELAEGLPKITADSVQLSQALINLVINALQAAPARGHVWLRTRPLSATEQAVEISDDGPGIPAADQARIFEPYFTTKSQGSGLGLWITQQIVLAHTGTLTVNSQPEHGSMFTIKLPVQPGGPKP
jgi:signal transduction histidine kinase